MPLINKSNSVALFVGIIGLCLLFYLCYIVIGDKNTSKAHISFYHWKSGLSDRAIMSDYMRNDTASMLYLHYGDIVWDEEQGKARPEAVLQKINHDLSPIHIVPVFYVENEVFLQSDSLAAVLLADSIISFVKRVSVANKIGYHKIQIDCDWTRNSKQRYFDFLAAIRKKGGVAIEVTIRLHQIKYPKLTGIPPVDRGVLMYYNMGKIDADLLSPNSIYDARTAAPYLPSLYNYPLRLDVALPAYSWMIHTRDNRVVELIHQYESLALQDSTKYKSIGDGNAYRAATSFFDNGIYVMANDVFKLELINFELLNQAATQLGDFLPYTPDQIIIYKIDGLDTSEFNPKKIQTLLEAF